MFCLYPFLFLTFYLLMNLNYLTSIHTMQFNIILCSLSSHHGYNTCAENAH